MTEQEECAEHQARLSLASLENIQSPTHELWVCFSANILTTTICFLTEPVIVLYS